MRPAAPRMPERPAAAPAKPRAEEKKRECLARSNSRDGEIGAQRVCLALPASHRGDEVVAASTKPFRSD